MVRVQIVLHVRKILHRLLHLGIVPFHLAAEKIRPALGSDDSEERVLKELGGSPNPGITNAQGGNPGGFQLVANRKELVESHRVGHLDSILLQQFFVIPKDVAMVDASQYSVSLSVLRDHVDERLWKGLLPSITLVQVGNCLAVTRLHIIPEQLPAGVALPGVRRVIDGQARLQYGSGAGAAAAGDGSVNDTNPRVSLLVGAE